ncbi:MAG: hypothetical protein IJ012_05240 [Clostridia bacterium]|nr:hypothetical protein [Clostridia bacterium]
MKLTKFLYKHPILALLPAFLMIPVAAGLVYFEILTVNIASFLAPVTFFLLYFFQRRTPRVLFSAAADKLERECDPQAFLTDLRFLMSRRRLPFGFRLVLDMHYAVGLDAAGENEAAYAWFKQCLPARKRLSGPALLQFDKYYACVALHSEKGRGEAISMIPRLEEANAEFSGMPSIAVPTRMELDAMRDAAQYYTGNTEGLAARYAARIEQARPYPQARRRMLQSCIWLARVYDKEGRVREARGMYAYVAENGPLLGIAKEASKRLEEICNPKNNASPIDKTEENGYNENSPQG